MTDTAMPKSFSSQFEETGLSARRLLFEVGDLAEMSHTRGRILRGTASVFAEKGADGTTVADILQEAKVSRRTYYQYFSNKEAALDALFELATDGFANALTAAIADLDSPLVKLERAVSLYLELQYLGGALVIELQAEGIRPGSRLAQRRRRTLNFLVELFSENVEASVGKVFDPLVFQALIFALEGLCIHLHREGSFNQETAERVKSIVMPMVGRCFAREGEKLPALPLAFDLS